ncbi:hypothetical protein GcC1_122017 [Golovinomyces cichoracearum]|uniref:Uncharacterized protein n=1 Tax=Golovinomyces cichoracearum TaxID=62708 RepID=A0A420I6P9_9PEZI|nr:hypothetical protein GcC1_122017 [Golovinomyces cichoracearum]
MPGQRTIELVPTTLANPTSYKPPMTSKQVKRAYQKANQFKGLSRAELRRIEVEEIARQRKEFQKEKAQAKARASREAKAAKALAEVQSRKNSGIIAQSDGITRSRSQTSISAFTRNFSSIKRDRQIIHKAEEDDSDSWKKKSKGKKQKEEPYTKEPPKKRIATDPESSESEFDGFPFCTQLEMIVTSIDSKQDQSSQTTLVQPQKLLISQSENIKLKGLSDNLPVCEGTHKDILQGSVQQVAIQQISEECEAIPNPHIGNLPNHSEICTENDCSAELSCLRFCRNSQNNKSGNFCISRSRSPIQLQNTPSSISNNPPVKDGKLDDPKLNLSPKMNSPLSAHVLLRKPSSYDFLGLSNKKKGDYIDDCLDIVDFPSNTQVMSEISAECSAHCDRSSLKTSEKPQSSNSRSGETECKSTSICQSANFDDLICTQDLVFLSQELREIISLVPLEHKPSTNEKKASVEILKEKKRFFEEKEEDLLKAALYESKMMVTSVNSITDTLKESMERELAFSAPISHTPPVTSLTPHSSLSSPTTDYGTDEFFGDDWEELSALC